MKITNDDQLSRGGLIKTLLSFLISFWTTLISGKANQASNHAKNRHKSQKFVAGSILVIISYGNEMAATPPSPKEAIWGEFMIGPSNHLYLYAPLYL